MANAFAHTNTCRYGLLGMALAFVALPLYVVLPNYYAREFGVPLASLGAVLLAARLLDAFIDPALGRWSDRMFARSPALVLRWGVLAAAFLALGFAGLFFPQVARGAGQNPNTLLLWAFALLLITYTAYSALSVAHQSWGARYGGNEAQRSRVVAWREGFGLVGVLMASILPIVSGVGSSVAMFCVVLICGVWAWCVAAYPPSSPAGAAETSVWQPLKQPAFRKLLAIFMVNGIASAIPATLVLFFIQDKLQAPKAFEGAFLGVYFLAAALCIPLWLRVIARFGLARSWLAGMVLAVLVFMGAAGLGAGDVAWFMLVCALSGVALGADLTVPSAMLAGLIADAGDSGSAEGAYFGWWNFATKLNLALAAGLALPVLQAFGYAPGARSPEALSALVLAYCILPCALKCIAGYVLFTVTFRKKS